MAQVKGDIASRSELERVLSSDNFSSVLEDKPSFRCAIGRLGKPCGFFREVFWKHEGHMPNVKGRRAVRRCFHCLVDSFSFGLQSEEDLVQKH